MSKPIIEVQNLSKLYKLGSIGTGTLSHDLNRWWQKRKGKNPSPGEFELNDSTQKASPHYIWSLKDINFRVNEGEIVGVIGKNGAGKSTLLKLVSKITKPTTGQILLNGRIASLLEVGTGFHPDLTGKENIFLNGAILGMKKAEITSKFDEIVDFSGVERFIDTPVKRYSSGMYVRLAFAVAAHLEPEILIIDEVLAVGDAEFQQKCMAKIKDVSTNHGRTILFVSHNIAAIKHLCSKALFLESGIRKAFGDTGQVIQLYQEKETDPEGGKRGNIPYPCAGYFTGWHVESKDVSDTHTCNARETTTLVFSFEATEFLGNCEFRFSLFDERATILNLSSLDNKGTPFSIEPGRYDFRCTLQLPLSSGNYHIEAGFISMGALTDRWYSTTRLTILDNYESHTDGAILNIHSSFAIENSGAISLHRNKARLTINEADAK